MTAKAEKFIRELSRLAVGGELEQASGFALEPQAVPVMICGNY